MQPSRWLLEDFAFCVNSDDSFLPLEGVLDRFSQIQPKLIFSVEAVVYNGKEHDHIDKLQQVVKGLADLKKVVVIPYVSSREKIDISKIPNSVFLEDFLATGQGAQAPQLEFEQLPFSHPLFIMFSSGTTGAPKCMVHSAGGTLIQHLKEHVLHGNMTSSDIILYYTTVGWMMWNWMVSALATGAAVVLYDGSPLVPTPNVLWDLVDRIGITILGTGAKWLSVLEEKDVKPVETHSLQTLHTILSTGSPLKAQSYDYVYRCIKSSVLLGSISAPRRTWFWASGESVDESYVGVMPSEGVCPGSRSGSCPPGVTESLCPPAGVWVHGDYCRINPKTRGIIMLGRRSLWSELMEHFGEDSPCVTRLAGVRPSHRDSGLDMAKVTAGGLVTPRGTRAGI
ncbi:Acetoacetyl-CoA synthetase, partial [Eschrichtius robustus]|nr:Acetoacetyl-CoA synthetase [Eschrichtius robustus]